MINNTKEKFNELKSEMVKVWYAEPQGWPFAAIFLFLTFVHVLALYRSYVLLGRSPYIISILTLLMFILAVAELLPEDNNRLAGQIRTLSFSLYTILLIPLFYQHIILGG